LLELERLSSEPIDSTGNELLLDVLAELVVELELGLDVLIEVLVLLLRGLAGLKKSKNEGVGMVFLTMRVCLVFLFLCFFALHLDCQILASLPVDLITLCMIIDEVAAVSVLFLVEVGL